MVVLSGRASILFEIQVSTLLSLLLVCTLALASQARDEWEPTKNILKGTGIEVMEEAQTQCMIALSCT